MKRRKLVFKILNKCRVFLQGFLLLNLIWLIASLLLNINVIPNPFAVYKDFGSLFANKILIHILYSKAGSHLALCFLLQWAFRLASLWRILKKRTEYCIRLFTSAIRYRKQPCFLLPCSFGVCVTVRK